MRRATMVSAGWLSHSWTTVRSSRPAVHSMIQIKATTTRASCLPSPLCEGRRFFSASVPCYGRRLGRGRRIRHREPSPGDWLCQCGEMNYRSKRECFKCGSPAPPLPPGVRRPTLPGEDPLDWACPCGVMNFRGSVVCHKCQQPKPQPPPLPGQEVTLWTCPKCKGVNRNTRKFCFKCSTPSPLVAFKPVAG